jgi:hypothetical protein
MNRPNNPMYRIEAINRAARQVVFSDGHTSPILSAHDDTGVECSYDDPKTFFFVAQAQDGKYVLEFFESFDPVGAAN